MDTIEFVQALGATITDAELRRTAAPGYGSRVIARGVIDEAISNPEYDSLGLDLALLSNEQRESVERELTAQLHARLIAPAA